MILYTTNDDIVRCKSIVELELKKNAIVVNPKKLDELTIDIMNLVYAKGGSYSDKTIQQFAQAYIIRLLSDKSGEYL